MRPHPPGRRVGKTGADPEVGSPARARHKVRTAIETGVLTGLLLVSAASALVGSSAMLFGAVMGSWLVLAWIVGLRNLLDAGCAYTLLVVGVIVVVDLAANGPASLLH